MGCGILVVPKRCLGMRSTLRSPKMLCPRPLSGPTTQIWSRTPRFAWFWRESALKGPTNHTPTGLKFEFKKNSWFFLEKYLDFQKKVSLPKHTFGARWELDPWLPIFGMSLKVTENNISTPWSQFWKLEFWSNFFTTSGTLTEVHYFEWLSVRLCISLFFCASMGETDRITI